jgi:hypothetical protein
VPPQRELRFWLRAADSTASVGLGELDHPEITITRSYDTTAGINRSELERQRAHLQGAPTCKERSNSTESRSSRWPCVAY